MVKISLPTPNDSISVKQFLRQLELSVHHAQKAYEELEKDDIAEGTYIMYRFPKMNLYGRKQNDKGEVLVHVDEEGDEFQEIELEINKI